MGAGHGRRASTSLHAHSFAGFLAMFLLLFVTTGIGNGSTFRMIPRHLPAPRAARGRGQGREAERRALEVARRESAAVLGFTLGHRRLRRLPHPALVRRLDQGHGRRQRGARLLPGLLRDLRRADLVVLRTQGRAGGVGRAQPRRGAGLNRGEDDEHEQPSTKGNGRERHIERNTRRGAGTVGRVRTSASVGLALCLLAAAPARAGEPAAAPGPLAMTTPAPAETPAVAATAPPTVAPAPSVPPPPPIRCPAAPPRHARGR